MNLKLCPYCSSLTPAMENANYCSHHQSDSSVINSNAYFFAHSNSHSNRHQSRFSIRALKKGYQYYQIKKRVHILHRENFLIVNEGELFENYIEPYGKAEGTIIAFNTKFLQQYLFELNHSNLQLLDRPNGKTPNTLYFYENTYLRNPALNTLFKEITDSIRLGIKAPIFYQQRFVKLLDAIVASQNSLLYQIETIQAAKKSTKEELYHRLSDAKDFMDAHLSEQITLQKIAKNACLSPFHFLRTFSALFQISPYQYLLNQRLKKAHFLINQGKLTIPEIMNLTGFENKRSFQRAFAKMYGITPYELLKKFAFLEI